MAAEVRAAGEVVAASEVEVGEPVEVLLRTFVPIGRQGILPGTNPREPYPAPSGSWNVLFPWHDYPFDVVGQHDGDTDVPVTLTRDPLDATSTDGVKLLAQRRASVDVRRGDSGGPMFYGNRACGVISLVAGSVIGSNPTVWSELIDSQIRDVKFS